MKPRPRSDIESVPYALRSARGASRGQIADGAVVLSLALLGLARKAFGKSPRERFEGSNRSEIPFSTTLRSAAATIASSVCLPRCAEACHSMPSGTSLGACCAPMPSRPLHWRDSVLRLRFCVTDSFTTSGNSLIPIRETISRSAYLHCSRNSKALYAT